MRLARRKRLLALWKCRRCVFLPVIQRLKGLIRAENIGRIVMADFSSSFSSSYNSWLFDAEKGGGPLYSNASYSLHLMQYLLDCYAAEWTGLCSPSGTGVETQFSAVLRMKRRHTFHQQDKHAG